MENQPLSPEEKIRRLEEENKRLKDQNDLLLKVNVGLLEKLEAKEIEKGGKPEILPPKSNVEQKNKSEKVKFSMTKEEFQYIDSLPLDSKELTDWMKERNISFESGDIMIYFDGVIRKMSCSKEDFGTLVDF